MKDSYDEFISSKSPRDIPTGFTVSRDQIHPSLFDFQRDIVRWGLMRGRAAFFEGTGLGKSRQQIEWSRLVSEHTDGMVLMLTPLAVADQTIREGKHIGVDIVRAYSQSDCKKPGIYITNYQQLHNFRCKEFVGVDLDEASILKSLDGKFRNKLIEEFSETPFRLAATATPSPNDHMEIGSYAEFLSVMTTTEMLAMFFCHDGGETQKWRLKGHAEDDFWKWMASWSVCLSHPRDLGYEQEGYDLPPLVYHEHIVASKMEAKPGELFAIASNSLEDSRAARKSSLEDRCKKAAEIANSLGKESVLVWCDLNDESTMLAGMIDGGVEVTGSDDDDHKEKTMLGFADGNIRCMVSKPAICGFGLNLQICNQIIFVGVTHSFERFYQAVRRCWRFGQARPVNVHIVISDQETGVLNTIKRKESDAKRMIEEMTQHMAHISKGELLEGQKRDAARYRRETAKGDGWEVQLGDCVEVIQDIPDNSLHFSIFSPPFASLYTYSASERDMGNVRDQEEFFVHFGFLVKELFRAMMPGRLVSMHCMNLPTSKERDGYIGIRDFRGDLIRAFEKEGFIYHSEVCIWKDPVTAMQRTKALGLLHKTIRKDSSMSRQGIPDYLVTMRKPGDNPERISHTHEEFPVSLWQRYASPVWMDINPSKTLQKESAREEKDERHICPLQLQVIERALELWTNKGDTVFSPFTGIGSEGYVSIQMGRKFKGAELKESYWKQAVLNLKAAEIQQHDIFSSSEE